MVIQGGEEQEKRWAALCGRLSGEKTQRALAEGVCFLVFVFVVGLRMHISLPLYRWVYVCAL